MLKWIKFLIREISDDLVLNLIKWLIRRIQVKETIDTICDWLQEQALKTENKVDDALVKMIKDWLYAAFLISDKRVDDEDSQ